MTKQLDLSKLFAPMQKQNERFTSKHAVNIHEFYLVGDIESPEEYIEWFDIIRNSGQSDIVKIYVNSAGGDLFTAIQFLRVLGECSATVVISIEGICASAATMIMLAGDQFEVSEHSMFMFHNYSGGTIGKGGEMWDRLEHERKWSEKLMRSIYDEFLTESEIVSILDGKDIWMDGDEVIKRLEDKVKKEKEAEEAEEATIEEKPKPTRKKTQTRKTAVDNLKEK